MGLFEICSLLIVLAALFSYVNCRYIRLPTTIGVMAMALIGSLAVVAAGDGLPALRAHVTQLMAGIDLRAVVLHGMLAFLLFAGSLHLDLGDLGREWDVIAVLALAGTAITTLLVAGLSSLALWWFGLPLPFGTCLLFGALIAPTDPIAVIGVMRKIGAPRALEVVVSAEALFNDGVGVVFFLTVLGVVSGERAATVTGVSLMLAQEVIGGAALGLACGLFIYHLLKRVDNYQVEVLLTLALAMGGYSLAEAIHVSAPIAVVVAGLFVGNRGREFAMSRQTREHLDSFWELIDEVLNAVLFLLIGMLVLVTPFTRRYLWAGLAAVAIVLAARWLAVFSLVKAMEAWRSFGRGTVTVLSWCGLRGGLSVAMALALPPGKPREIIVAMTYCVVVFSILVQGLTASRVTRAATALGPQ